MSAAEPAGSPPAMHRNIELKARLDSLDAVREIVRRIATRYEGHQQQRDTYFHCPTGRLKLREIDAQAAQLVWYARPDQEAAKASDYVLVPVSNPHTLKGALTAALGVRGVVRKRREVFLWDNVRIHLDEVDALGTFLELEAVVSEKIDDRAAHAQIEQLAAQLEISPSSLIKGSYGDYSPGEVIEPSPPGR